MSAYDDIAPAALLVHVPDGNGWDGEAAVRRFFAALLDAGISFHCEETLSEIVDMRTGEAVFAEHEAIALDTAMDRCYDLVPDPCAIGCEMLTARLAC